jgi:toxin ParE1/3/4
MRIEWTAEAAAELDHLLAYIADQDYMAAALVAGRVLKAEESIASFPKAGRHDAATDTYDRFIPRTRIILTYAIREDAIWVLSVWHTSRDPETRRR